MLISDRHQGLIYFCLVGMEVSWYSLRTQSRRPLGRPSSSGMSD